MDQVLIEQTFKILGITTAAGKKENSPSRVVDDLSKDPRQKTIFFVYSNTTHRKEFDHAELGTNP